MMEIYLRYRLIADGVAGAPSGAAIHRKIVVPDSLDASILVDQLKVNEIAQWDGGILNGRVCGSWIRKGPLQAGCTYTINHFIDSQVTGVDRLASFQYRPPSYLKNLD